MLAALFFVPSATASPGHGSADKAVTHTGTAAPASGTAHATQTLGLADTGSIDTTPYVVGGAAFLVAGAGLVLNAGRRTRRTL